MAKLITTVLVAAALAVSVLVRAQPAPLRIGVNFERTGSISSYGQHALVSAQIAVEEINKAGGVNGAPIELLIEDNKSSPEQSVIATRNLADKGVFAMLGPVTAWFKTGSHVMLGWRCQEGWWHPAVFRCGGRMDWCVGAAARLPGGDRKDLAIQALARSETVSDLAARHGVSRKFVYQQTHKARAVLDDAFSPAVPDSEVLFEVAVTKAWLRQVIVGLTLICRASYRGVVEFLRDLLGVPVSVGCVHDVLQAATREASAINHDQDLSGIRVGLHDEIFQGATPVLAGVDAASTYCYLLAAEQRRDADTWGVHLLDAAQQGLDPDYTIADAGQGLRAGQRAAWGDTPCHGDVFHIQRQCEGLANTLARLAQGTTSRRQTLQAKINPTHQRGPDGELATQLALARQAEARAHELARDIRTLTQWLRHDVLALAGPALATRQALFDFLVEELAQREPGDARRIRPVRVALQNQRDTLLAFTSVLDGKLAAIAQTHAVAESLVREACVLHRLPSTSPAYWQGWNRLRATMGCKFHMLVNAVSRAMADTPRSSSLVENLNSRLRTYFTLRRHLGGSYLDLLRFFLNHRRFLRSRRAERRGKSPRELMTGQGHPHWLTLLGLGPLQPQRA